MSEKTSQNQQPDLQLLSRIVPEAIVNGFAFYCEQNPERQREDLISEFSSFEVSNMVNSTIGELKMPESVYKRLIWMGTFLVEEIIIAHEKIRLLQLIKDKNA